MIDAINDAAYVVLGLMFCAVGVALLIMAMVGYWWAGLIPGALCLLSVFVPDDMGAALRLTIGATLFAVTGLAVLSLAAYGTVPGTRRLKVPARGIGLVLGVVALAVGVALVKAHMHL